jgi:membrane protease YdiL (CAAX protease family)
MKGREQSNSSRTLNARSAAIIFAAYYIAQMLLCALLYAIGGDRLGPLADFLFPIVGFVVMVSVARVFIPEDLRKAGPTGSAWAFGGWNGVIKSLVIGSFLGLGSLLFFKMYHPYSIHTLQKIEPIYSMVITPGVQQAAAIAASVFLAPVSEEMMFRGVLYGGCRRSLGPLSAATITTGIFVAIHFPYYIYAPLGIIPIIVTSLAFLWCRLKWNAIGPAIAAHAGCNLVHVVTSIHWALQHSRDL